MKTRKQVAELAAILASRFNNGSHFKHERIADDTLLICRLGTAAETIATNLCNLPNYQSMFKKRKAVILKRLAPMQAAYSVSFELNGDPRGYCLRMFASKDLGPFPINTWGDEAGYGI